MDISGLSTAVKQSDVALKVSIAVTKKAMDTSSANSASVIKMLQDSNPNLGKTIDSLAWGCRTMHISH